jgi:hypothetical protein
LGEKPILKTAFNIRQFAGVTGNGLYQWYYEQVKARDTDPDSKFYNWGWWDFRFDDMLYRHDYGEVPAVAPTQAEQAKWFRDIGWVAFHHEMASENDHIMFLTKSSPYGSISHSHGDQNSILIHAFGEPLAIKSGYYIGFNTTMHTKWRRQTRSHNSLLIDGVGQYAEINKFLNISARGVIEQVENAAKHQYVKANASEAYRETVPYLKDFTRETYFVGGSYLVVVDSVSLAQAGQVNWLLHALHEFGITGQTFNIPGQRAELDGRFVYCSSGKLELAQYDGFPDVDPQEWAGLPTQWHLTATTKAAHEHRIVTLLTPKRKGERKYVTDFVDDQGHGLNIYFTEKGETFHLHVATAY